MNPPPLRPIPRLAPENQPVLSRPTIGGVHVPQHQWEDHLNTQPIIDTDDSEPPVRCPQCGLVMEETLGGFVCDNGHSAHNDPAYAPMVDMHDGHYRGVPNPSIAGRTSLPPPPPLNRPDLPPPPPVRNNLPPPPPPVVLVPEVKAETVPLVFGGKRGATNADGKDICIPLMDRKSYMVYASLAMTVDALKRIRNTWPDAKGLDIKKLDAAIVACSQVADGPFLYLQMDREFTIDPNKRRPELIDPETPEQDATE